MSSYCADNMVGRDKVPALTLTAGTVTDETITKYQLNCFSFSPFLVCDLFLSLNEVVYYRRQTGGYRLSSKPLRELRSIDIT